jgi:hypothetical protein
MNRAFHLVATAGSAIIPDPTFERVSRLIEAATYDLSPERKMEVLMRVLQDLLDRESRVPESLSQLLRSALRARGQALLMRLLRENWEHIGSAATVRERFSIANSTLYRAKEKGSVIAFRPPDGSDFLFPLEQFSSNKIAPWAAEVVHAGKNGAPAICFLYVKRRQMRWRSFADGLRDPKQRKATVQKLLSAAQNVAADL